MCMMNMMGHPMKLDMLKLFRDAAAIFNEDAISKIPERISGDRFIGRLAMKTGSSMQYLLRIDAMLIKFFGSTLLDMIQTLALEISKISDKDLSIPPGQLINLVIEALDDKIETAFYHIISLVKTCIWEMPIKYLVGHACIIMFIYYVLYIFMYIFTILEKLRDYLFRFCNIARDTLGISRVNILCVIYALQRFSFCACIISCCTYRV